MNIEEQIAELLAQAEPLRVLPDDQQAASPLGAIVDRINALRAVQAANPHARPIEPPQPDPMKPVIVPAVELPKRRPGRPRKEGADA